MQQRRDEILAKKARLADLKRQRELRQKEFTQNKQSTGEPSELTTPARPDNRRDLDSLISSLVGDSRPGSATPKDSGAASPSLRASRPSSVLSSGHPNLEQPESASSDSRRISTTSVATQTLTTVPASTNYEFLPAPTPEVLTYSKGIQTSEPWSPQRRHDTADGFSDSDDVFSPSKSRSPKTSKKLSRRDREKEEELRQQLRREIEEELKVVKDPLADEPVSQAAPQNFPARALTDDEVKAVTSSEDFLDFVEKSSKVIERALDQEYDVLANYALDGLEGPDDDDEDEGYGSSRSKKSTRIREVAQFWDERWSRKRMISDIAFSPKFPELVLASYTKNPSSPHDPSGLVQIWNLHLQSRPEYTFHATSDILTAKFSPFHPSLILGGTYSGQILLWDTRSKSPYPVSQTPLTGGAHHSAGHTHPIYSLSLVGTQHAHNIISCSTDGVVCSWSVDMLARPTESLHLLTPPPTSLKTEDLAPTCMAFPTSDPTSFVVGTEEGTIYPCHRYDRAGARAGVDPRVRYKAHAAPVMSVDFHPGRGQVDLGDLMLSSSLDWSVRLWKVRSTGTGSASTSTATTTASASASIIPSGIGGSASGAGAQVTTYTPVMDFVREDVVYDARWAPHRPSVFALVDGGGSLEVWDVNVDTEVPVARAQPGLHKGARGGGGGGGGLGYGQGVGAGKSLNKVRWEEREGRRVVVGGVAGVVTVFEVGAGLSGEGTGEEGRGVRRLVGRGGAG